MVLPAAAAGARIAMAGRGAAAARNGGVVKNSLSKTSVLKHRLNSQLARRQTVLNSLASASKDDKKNLKGRLDKLDNIISLYKKKLNESSPDYEQGLKRGGEKKGSNKFVSKESFDRYKQRFGDSAAKERFFGVKEFKDVNSSDPNNQGYFGQKLQANKDHYANKYNNFTQAVSDKIEDSKKYTSTDFYKEKGKEQLDKVLDPQKRSQLDIKGKAIRGVKAPFKLVGKGLGGVLAIGGLGLKGVGSGFSWLFKSSNFDKSQINRSFAQLLLFVALIVHLVDWYRWNFVINAEVFPLRVFLYLVLAMIAFPTLKMSIGDSFKHFTIVSLIPLLFLPLLLHFIETAGLLNVARILSILMFALPAWLIYLIMIGVKSGPMGKTVSFYFVIVSIIVLFQVTTSFAGSLGNTIETQGVDSDSTVHETLEFLRNSRTAMYESANSTWNAITGRIDRQINETLGRGYQAQVESAADRAGVFLTNLRPVGQFYESQPIRLMADFNAISYLDNVNVDFFCSIRDRNGREVVVPGSPPNINVSDFENRIIFCDFDLEEHNFSSGRFDARIQANFNFITSAYSTYYFVPRSSLEDGSRQSWNQRHRIPQIPENIFTGGPVFIGMNETVRVPIPTLEDRSTFFALDFGIRNNLQRGELQRITFFETRLPRALEISPSQCSVPLSQISQDSTEGYAVYRYELPPNVTRNFLAVSCNVEIPLDMVDEVSTPGIRPVTIFAQVGYDYSIAHSTSINVLALRGDDS